MSLPEPNRFNIKDLAKRWGESEEHVRELIRDGQFKQILVYEQGAIYAFTQHYYIDPSVAADTAFPITPIYSRKPSVSLRPSNREWKGSIHSIEDFPWPSNESTLYIPRTEVEAFEEKYRIRPNRGATTHANQKSKEIAAKAGLDTTSDPYGQKWIKIAKKIGTELANKHKKLNLERIAELVHEEMVRRKSEPGMTGRSDEVPKPETIKRWALKGITVRRE